MRGALYASHFYGNFGAEGKNTENRFAYLQSLLHLLSDIISSPKQRHFARMSDGLYGIMSPLMFCCLQVSLWFGPTPYQPTIQPTETSSYHLSTSHIIKSSISWVVKQNLTLRRAKIHLYSNE
jgi:hypothetical protein